MEADENWEDDQIESISFGNDVPLEEDPSPTSSVLNRIIGVIIAISVGFYAGLVCRTMQEAWIYAALFLSEGLICALVTGIIKSYSLKQTMTVFAVYFVISALSAPLSCWIGFQLA